MIMTEHTDAADRTPEGARAGDHYGQDGGREEIAATDTQKGRSGEATQDLPAMSQNDADVSQKTEGILVQTQADIAGHDDVDGRQILITRLGEAGISLSSDELDALASRLGS